MNTIALLDEIGKVLIKRDYREPLTVNFHPSAPVHYDPVLKQTTFYIKWNNIYLTAVTDTNCNTTTLLVFLTKLKETLVSYFTELNEESIRDNFIIIYELLDEMMDYGYPQVTQDTILKTYITQDAYQLQSLLGGAQSVPTTVTNSISWRNPDIKYRKNEVFLDVIESVNCLIAANGTVIKSDVSGSIKMRCFLSGMPELRLGLNDKVLLEQRGTGKKAIDLEDVKFHQCVRLAKFSTDRTISFIPPDGEFELMSYRVNTQVKPLISCESVIEYYSSSRVEYLIKAKSQFKRRSTANNVEIIVPVPVDADTPKFKCSTGSVQYAPDKNAFIWKIKQFQGGKDFLMRAHFGLPSVNQVDNFCKQPIQVKYEIPYFTISGIQVRYLKIVEKSGYQALPWVRYITQDGEYFMRMPDYVVGSSRMMQSI